MKHLVLKSGSKKLRPRFYTKNAPATCKAFSGILPFSEKAVHARFAGEEIYVPNGPALKIPKENTKIAPRFGEIGYALVHPKSQVSRSIAVVYGKAKFSVPVNMFAKIFKQDSAKIKKFGEQIWLKGSRKIRFELSK